MSNEAVCRIAPVTLGHYFEYFIAFLYASHQEPVGTVQVLLPPERVVDPPKYAFSVLIYLSDFNVNIFHRYICEGHNALVCCTQPDMKHVFRLV